MNVHSMEGIEDYDEYVQLLCAALVADALIAGFTPDDIDETVGDLDEYMTDTYKAVINYNLGFEN